MLDSELPDELAPGRVSFWIRHRRWIILVLVWSFAALSALPVLFHWPARPPRISRINLAHEIGYGSAALICLRIYWVESRRMSRSRALSLVILIFLLTGLANHIHAVNVDYLPNTSDMSHADWQKMLQNAVVQSSPGVLPHSYRFLPNGIVRWAEYYNVPFELARDLYRLLTGLLLFYAVYRYARLYTDYLGGVLALLFSSVAFPVSFEWYAGQLTDPLSHLSFVLAFIFLATEDVAFLLTTLVIGSLAKETVFCLVGYYILFCRKESRYAAKAVALSIATLIAFFGVRLLVLQQGMHYNQISNVNLDHVSINLNDTHWPMAFLLTAVFYLPFLALGWKNTPAVLRTLAIFLVVVLFVSSMFFSWLSEARNYMPAVFVLSVIAARHFISPSVRVIPTDSVTVAVL